MASRDDDDDDVGGGPPIGRRELLQGAVAAAVLGACGGRAAAPQEEVGTMTASQATTAPSGRMPTIYLPHGGGPCFFMDWDPPGTWDAMGEWLRGLGTGLPAPPLALLVVSAHWEERVATVTSGAAPTLVYDYYGFPPHTYELTWPAPGAPALAARVQALLGEAGIACAANAERGFDHGVFIPLKLGWPAADVPTAQLSLVAGLDPAAHLALGRALAPLRDEGVLILGSGMSFHNLRAFFGRGGDMLAPSQAFDGWLVESVSQPTAAARAARLTAWEQAPSARACHPREEHLIPLMVCAGAAGDDVGEAVYRDVVLRAAVSGVRFG